MFVEPLFPPPPSHDTDLSLKEVQTPSVSCQQGAEALDTLRPCSPGDKLPGVVQVVGGPRSGLDNLTASHLFDRCLPTYYQG